MTGTIAEILDKVMNPVIVAGFLVVLYRIISLAGDLGKLKTEADDKLLHMKGVSAVNPKTLAMRQRNTAIASRDTSYELRDRYQKDCSRYAAISHLIPVFPLLGILGTVAGLFIQVGTGDASVIYSALSMALSTTLYGLLAAVVLKVIEALAIVKRMNDVESIFDSYDIRYQDATLQRDFSDETNS